MVETSRLLVAKLPDATKPQSLASWIQHDVEKTKADYAAQAFEALGEKARPAIDPLQSLMCDNSRPNSSRRATVALACIGMDALPTLRARLADTNAPNREDVVSLIRFVPALQTNEPTLLPILIGCLQANTSVVQLEAAISLGWMGHYTKPQPSVVVPALTNCLGPNTSPNLKYFAAWALGEYGYHARSATPLLMQMLQSTNEGCCRQATNALQRIAPEALTNAPPK